MEEVAELFREAAKRTEFELQVSSRRETTLKRRESTSETRTNLHTKTLGRIPFVELRNTYEGGTWRSGEWGESLQIKAIYGDGAAERLDSQLRRILKDHIAPDGVHVGHGLVGLIGGTELRVLGQGLKPAYAISTLGDFRDYLIVAAAVLGPDRLAGIIGAWVGGEPLRFRVMALLAGVRIDRPLALDSGIGLERLPASSVDLPESLPGLSEVAPTSYLGGVVLSVQCEAAPALFKPPIDGSGHWNLSVNVQRYSWGLDETSIDAFCEALSLSISGCVRCKGTWRDYGELREFSEPSSWVSEPARVVEDRLPEASFTETHLREAWEIHQQRINRQANDGIGTAISRWVNSKRPEASLPDRFIDLRIALEALYLDGKSRAEMAFRIATYGAWHSGGSVEDRCRNHAALRKAYNLSSAAVHAGRVKDSEENRELLKTVQRLCRAGIIERLKEDSRPDWTRRILGG